MEYSVRSLYPVAPTGEYGSLSWFDHQMCIAFRNSNKETMHHIRHSLRQHLSCHFCCRDNKFLTARCSVYSGHTMKMKIPGHYNKAASCVYETSLWSCCILFRENFLPESYAAGYHVPCRNHQQEKQVAAFPVSIGPSPSIKYLFLPFALAGTLPQ